MPRKISNGVENGKNSISWSSQKQSSNRLILSLNNRLFPENFLPITMVLSELKRSPRNKGNTAADGYSVF